MERKTHGSGFLSSAIKEEQGILTDSGLISLLSKKQKTPGLHTMLSLKCIDSATFLSQGGDSRKLLTLQ